MIHYSTFLYLVLLFYCRCQISYTPCVLETSILLPPLSYSFRTSPLLLLLQDTLVMAPNDEVEDIITMTSSQSKVHSLKAAIFHTMAYKLSLEINKNKITPNYFCFSQSSVQRCPDQDEKNHF